MRTKLQNLLTQKTKFNSSFTKTNIKLSQSSSKRSDIASWNLINKTENYQENLSLINLIKKVKELETYIVKLEKENNHLKEINKYLLLSNQSKIELLKSERKHKSYLILPKNNEFKSVKTEESEIPILKHTMNQISLNKLGKDNLEQPLATSPRKTYISSQKTNIINFVSLEETFKISKIIDLHMSDEEALNLYKSDGCLKLINELLSDEEQFLEIVLTSRQQKLSFIYDKIKRLFNDHYQLFQLILRLKKIIQGVLQMNQSLLLDDCLNAIVQKMIQCLDCDRATCFLLDHTKNELWSRVAKGTSKIIRLPVGEGIAGCVALDKKIINIRNAYQDSRFNKENDKKLNYKTKTILACPIMGGQKCLGVLQCINKHENVFTQEDESLLQILSEQSSVVLGNAINLNEQNIQYNKLRHIIQSVIYFAQSNSVKELILNGENRIQALLNIDKAKICYVKARQKKIIHYDSEGQELEHNDDQGIIGEAIQKKKIISVKCSYQDIRFNELIDINSNLPVIAIPIENPNNKENIIGGLEIILLKGMNSIDKNEDPKLDRLDYEILNSFCQVFAQFLFLKLNNNCSNEN